MLALKIQFTKFFLVFLFAYFLILWQILNVLSVFLSFLLGYTRWDPDHVKKTKVRLCHLPLLLTRSQHHFIRHLPNSQHDAPVCTSISLWTMWGVPAPVWVDLRKGQENRPVVCGGACLTPSTSKRAGLAAPPPPHPRHNCSPSRGGAPWCSETRWASLRTGLRAGMSVNRRWRCCHSWRESPAPRLASCTSV